MKTLRVLALAVILLAFLSHRLNAKPDADRYRVGFIDTKDEFVPCGPFPGDKASIERGWRYLLRYIQYDPARDLNAGFSLMLVRVQKSGQFVLAVHQGEQVTVAQFTEANDEEKIRLASATKVVERKFAQALYEFWIDALLHARYGRSPFTTMDGGCYYLSVFTVDAGHMSAITEDYQSGKTTGKIRSVSLLLKNYCEESDPEKSGQIAAKITSALDQK